MKLVQDRILGRVMARELSKDELDEVAGGRCRSSYGTSSENMCTGTKIGNGPFQPEDDSDNGADD